MRAFVESVGLLGPGLESWESARATLRSAAPYLPAETILPRLEVLPAAERRRTGVPAKLALATGLDALAGSPRQACSLPTVFTSSGGDGQVLHEICETLTTAERQVSPTRFHNSVHNAPAGYWSIATQSREPSTSLCAYDWSFAAGLLEATAQVLIEHDAVLLVSFDMPYPEPMHMLRPIHGVLGIALLLARSHSEKARASLDIDLTERTVPPTPCADPQLEELRAHNPTGRALPLLAALAAGVDAHVQPGLRRAAEPARARVPSAPTSLAPKSKFGTGRQDAKTPRKPCLRPWCFSKTNYAGAHAVVERTRCGCGSSWRLGVLAANPALTNEKRRASPAFSRMQQRSSARSTARSGPRRRAARRCAHPAGDAT